VQNGIRREEARSEIYVEEINYDDPPYKVDGFYIDIDFRTIKYIRNRIEKDILYMEQLIEDFYKDNMQGDVDMEKISSELAIVISLNETIDFTLNQTPMDGEKPTDYFNIKEVDLFMSLDEGFFILNP